MKNCLYFEYAIGRRIGITIIIIIIIIGGSSSSSTKYFSGDQIKKNEMDVVCSTHGGEEGCTRVFVWIPEGRRLLGRPRRKLKDNIKMNLQEVGWGGMDWINLA